VAIKYIAWNFLRASVAQFVCRLSEQAQYIFYIKYVCYCVVGRDNMRLARRQQCTRTRCLRLQVQQLSY